MLEAFQRSAREDQARKARDSREAAERERPPENPERKPPARVVAEPPRPPRRSPRPEDIVSDGVLGAGARGRSWGNSAGFPSWLPVAAVLLLVAMAGTYGVGRLLGSDGEARAQGSNGEDLLESFEQDLATPGGGPSNPDAPPVAEEETLTDDDRRFLDHANRVTVQAILFENDRRGELRAYATYLHLRDSGLPVIAPIEQDNRYVLCVGAEPTINEKLKQIQTRLRALAGPPPQNEPGAFASAFFVNIDDTIDR